MRESQASASSVPPPRQAPSIAATVGHRKAASLPKAACARWIQPSTSSRDVIEPIACTSAPAHLERQREQQPGSARADRMTERDRAAVDVQPLERELAERAIPLQLVTGEGFRLGGLQAGQHLRGERLVDLEQLAVRQLEP